MTMKALCKKTTYGFALIEALVAMIVMSFGMLAVAGFQVNLSLNSDVAKQRTEATRLAQQKMEQLRTFDTLTVYENNMVSSTLASPVTQETITTNTTFTRSWAITSANNPDTGRSTTVTVAWTDRAGNPEKVQLVSHISATNPLLTGSLFFPLPDGTILRRPKNRSTDIPIPAISISGTGKSHIPWSGTSSGYLVFSDNSGDVVQKCSATPTMDNIIKDTENTNTTSTTSACVLFNGYLLTGYITGTASKVSLVTKVVVPFTSAQYISGTPECSVGPAYDQTTSTPAQIAGTKYYVCLIQPTDHDTSASTARVWSGRVDLAGDTAESLAGTQVCRFVASPTIPLPTITAPTITYNNNHPETYVRVDRSLDNQNFHISSGNCADTNAARVSHHTYTGTSILQVTYNGNGNTGGAVPVDNSSYALNATVTVLPAGTLVKSGFTFTGWNTAASGSGTNRAAASTFVITDDNMLYAQWSSTTSSVTYTVTYNSNGGTGTLPKDTTYTDASTVTVEANLLPTRSGFTFGGWSFSTNGDTVTSFQITANTILYAKWSKIKLTTPSVGWDNGKDPDDLKWSQVTGATGYKINSCSVNSASDCVPTTQAIQTALTRSPGFISGNPTSSCYQVIATDSGGGYDDSIASSVKCITRTTDSNGKHTYTKR